MHLSYRPSQKVQQWRKVVTKHLLSRNPTILEVTHELSHYIDFRNLGLQGYINLGRTGRELSVLGRLQGNRLWGALTAEEQIWSIDYASSLQ